MPTALHRTASGYTSLLQLAPSFLGTPAVAIILRISQVYVDDSPGTLALRSCPLTSFAPTQPPHPWLGRHVCSHKLKHLILQSPSSSHCLLNGSHRHCPSTGWRATVQHRAWGLLQLFVVTSLLNRLRRHGLPPVPFFASPCSFSSSRQKENFCSQKPLPRRYQNGMCFSTIDSNGWSW